MYILGTHIERFRKAIECRNKICSINCVALVWLLSSDQVGKVDSMKYILMYLPTNDPKIVPERRQ